MSRRGKKRAAQAITVPTERTELIVPKAIQAKFDIAQTTRENRVHWAGADSLSARASMSPGVRRVIRIRSRYEAENNSWYAGILRTATNHIAGNGPRLQLLTDNAEGNKRVERAYAKWAKMIQLADKRRTVVEAYWRDGEVFAMRAERPKHFPYTLDIRIFETEQVSSPLMAPILQDHFVDDGIRFDKQTNELEFYVYDHHPSGQIPTSTLSGKWYPADEVLHLFRAERPGQTRGLPRATPALQLLPIMRRQQLATLYSAETAANFALYLKSNSPAIDPTASPADFAEIELTRNMLTTLPAGWEMGQVEPRQPGPQYEMFQAHTLKSFSRCTNMPYPLAAGTAEQSNFSSFKGDMRNVWRPEVLSEQNNVEDSFDERIFGWFLEMAVWIPGLLDGMPPIDEIAHIWHWPPLPDLDPVDTANAGTIRLSSGQVTLTQLHAEAGRDWETEAATAAKDFGVDVATYKKSLFQKTFDVQPPPDQGGPSRGFRPPGGGNLAAAYNPDQPRAEDGKFGEGSGGGDSAPTAGSDSASKPSPALRSEIARSESAATEQISRAGGEEVLRMVREAGVTPEMISDIGFDDSPATQASEFEGALDSPVASAKRQAAAFVRDVQKAMKKRGVEFTPKPFAVSDEFKTVANAARQSHEAAVAKSVAKEMERAGRKPDLNEARRIVSERGTDPAEIARGVRELESVAGRVMELEAVS